MNYFSGCSTEAEGKATYRAYAMQYHPDRPGGSKEAFQDLHQQYETFLISKGFMTAREGHNIDWEVIFTSFDRSLLDPNAQIEISVWFFKNGWTSFVTLDCGASWANQLSEVTQEELKARSEPFTYRYRTEKGRTASGEGLKIKLSALEFADLWQARKS